MQNGEVRNDWQSETYLAKLPQYYLSYIGLAKERPGDEPSQLGHAEITQPPVNNVTAP